MPTEGTALEETRNFFPGWKVEVVRMSQKYALVIGNTEYNDLGLTQLSAPSKDAEDFARALKALCGFNDVKVWLNQSEPTIREAIDEFFDEKKPDDLLVLYFSGHGIRDEQGILYLAVKNTNRFRLRSTAVKSDFIREAMDQSRSKRQVLILDCCNSGAFAQGTKSATGISIGTASAFDAGYGRIILTASDATQFAWEGNKVIGETQNSLFTHYLIEGLKGSADSDGDGSITVDELYDYVYDQVRLATPKQTPSKFAAKQQGEIILREATRNADVKSLLQQNINLRQNASLMKKDITKSETHISESTLAKIKEIFIPTKTQTSSELKVDSESRLAKQVLVFIFWLFVVLMGLPFVISLFNLHIQNLVLVFWGSVIIFGVVGVNRGWTKESLVLLSAILALALNHIFYRYIPLVRDLSVTDVSLFWLRTMILEILVFLGYQFGRIISWRPSRLIAGNRFQERLLSAALGGFNGYLVAGTVLYYYVVADYPFQNALTKTTNPGLMQAINMMMVYMPPQILGEPIIYFALILAFLFILIILA